MKRVCFALLVMTMPTICSAQALTTTNYPGTVGTSAQMCVPADSTRKTLFIENPSGSPNNICYCIDCVPVCGNAGTSLLAPAASSWWSSGNAPREAINCVSDGSGSPVTVRTGK